MTPFSKSVLMASLLGASISSFALEMTDTKQSLTPSDFSVKKIRQSSLTQLTTFIESNNTVLKSTVRDSDSILQSIQQNSLGLKKLPENLIAVR
ncbi:hypothetical protein OPS25_06930 [Alteromonas ponticola]|uniref:Uncharacterized protein n=1 Tax=Alteromonas aquimaris TaxID=2998417 RepID=A0ABT3P634_9ALTE|nr:hypothetical protein [Alteromonas aquimaris]MCW8108224.1 hypothetical protein [Alteromonas aquimaris]